MRGRYAGRADLRCALNDAPLWERSVHSKQSAGSPQRASFIIRSRLEADRPQAPVEEGVCATGEDGAFFPLDKVQNNLRAFLVILAYISVHCGVGLRLLQGREITPAKVA